jgi:hypothetical protein
MFITQLGSHVHDSPLWLTSHPLGVVGSWVILLGHAFKARPMHWMHSSMHVRWETGNLQAHLY